MRFNTLIVSVFLTLVSAQDSSNTSPDSVMDTSNSSMGDTQSPTVITGDAASTSTLTSTSTGDMPTTVSGVSTTSGTSSGFSIKSNFVASLFGTIVAGYLAN
ncbi:hypothetical protein K502DRAFT_364016 [Neoconidiobolus thromboides FSU 785]|nr:hypothetical protein K502DRAFT_364016 [Neoconidiobolus thromboides FSU 785]